MKPHKTSNISCGSENFNFSKFSDALFKIRRDLLMQDRKCHLVEMRGDTRVTFRIYQRSFDRTLTRTCM